METGKPLDRVDGRLKVRGAAPYAAEYALPGLVHAALVQAGVGAGRVTRVDDSQARKAPGVLRVITFENAAQVGSSAFNPTILSLPVFGGPTIEYNGQHLAVVIADTFERARHAAGLMRFEYDRQPPRVDMEKFEAEAFAPGSAAPVARGDVALARQNAAERIEATYEIVAEHHNPLEPHATIATWQGDNLTVYDSTQAVQVCRETLAAIFDLPVENVRVISPFVGGTFGSKGSTWMHIPIAALAARTVGRPVKLVLRRQEMFTGHGGRAHIKQTIEIGAERDGTLGLIRHDTLNHTSMRDEWREETGRLTRMMYACPNVETSGKIVRLHKMPPTFMRGPNEGPGSVALECAMDEMAEKLGLDPVDFRLKNDTLTDGSNGKPFSSRALKETLLEGREAFGWSARPMKPGTLKEGNFLVGYGMACGAYPANYRFSSARMTISQSGQVTVRTASHEIGNGAYTIFTQIAADALSVPIASVRVELGDTRLPEGTHTGGSATSASTGAAILDAGNGLKARLIALILSHENNPLSGLSSKDVKAEDGRVFSIKEPARGVSYTDILKLTGQPRAEALGSTGKATRPDRSYWSFGTHFAKVRVDVELGQVRIEKMLGVYGGGRILNAKTARSQMLGAMIWGIGMALHEHTDYDPNNGRIVTRNLADYHFPCCADTPELDVRFIPETDLDISPIGAKGIGELGMIGSTASIANAIYNATGKRIREFPITPDKLVQ